MQVDFQVCEKHGRSAEYGQTFEGHRCGGSVRERADQFDERGWRTDAFHPRFFCPGREPEHFRKCEMGHPQAVQKRRDRCGKQAHPWLPVR
ncbi:hypothetical protein BW28_05795 [Clostridioides difficile]|nr:hypothetical protein BW28_05795 [Clostridioides difficile]